MPEPLDAEVVLDISDALSRVDDLRNTLEAALLEAVSSYSTAMADAISGVESALSGVDSSVSGATAAPIEVQVDTSGAVEQLSLLDDAAQTAAVDVQAVGQEGAASLDAVTQAGADAAASLDEVQTSAGGASEAVQSVGSAASDSAGGLDVAATATTGLNSAQGLMSGSSAGLEGAIGGATSSMGPYGAAAAGATAAVFGLAEAGLTAVSAEQRFNNILGDQKKAIEDVHVGDFSGDIFKLGLEFGSTRAEMQNSVATIYQHASAAGFAADKAGTYTDQLIAMAGRAVALNPALGNIGDVVDTLETKFARSRGLVQYGISISQSEINSRALTLSSKVLTADLTVQDKAFAGLQIATEKYGGSLNEVIAKGAANAANQQKALEASIKDAIEEMAKPLAAPFLQLMKEAVPIAVALGQILTQLARGVLPVMAESAAVLAPALGAVADVLKAIPTDVLRFGAALTNPIAMMQELDRVTGGFIGGALSSIGGALGIGGESIEDYHAKFGALAKDIRGESESGAAKKFMEDLGGQDSISLLTNGASAFGNAKSSFAAVKDELSALAAKSPDAAAKVVSGLAQMRDAGGKPIIDDKNLTKMDELVAKARTVATAAAEMAAKQQVAVESAKAHADAAGQDTIAMDAQSFTTAAATIATTAHASAEKAAVTDALALSEATGKTVTEVQAVATAYETASVAAKNYKTATAIANSTTLDVISAQQAEQAAIQATTKAITTSNNSLDVADEKGNKNVQTVISETKSAQAYADALVQQTGKQQAGTVAMQAYTAGLVAQLQAAEVQPAAIAGMLAQLGLTQDVVDPGTRALLGLADAAGTAVPEAATTGITGATNTLAAGASQMGPAAQHAAETTTQAYETAIADGLSKGTAKAIGTAVTAFEKDASVKAAATKGGTDAGVAFGQGLAAGMDSETPYVRERATALVDEAAAAARTAGVVKSPSKLFAEIGSQLGQGLSAGLDSEQGSVVARAEAIVRAAAAAALGTAAVLGGSNTPAGIPASVLAGGAGAPEVRLAIDVTVTGAASTDPATLAAVQQGVSEGVASGLSGADLRSIVVGVHTG